MIKKNVRISSLFLLAIGLIISTASKADETTYITEVKTIEELYQQCLETVSKTHNINCIKGNDETLKTGGNSSKDDIPTPWSIFRKASNKNEVDRNNEEDLRILFNMKVGGDAPNTGDVYHYAFLHIYKKFYAYGKIPVVMATASLYTVQPGRAGSSHHSSKIVEKWFSETLKALPITKRSSPEGSVIAAKYQALLDEDSQREREAINSSREKIKPSCTSIRFTGIAAVYPEDLATVNRSNDKDDLLSAHPMYCQKQTYGGRVVNGAVINPKSMTRCKGIGYFKNHKAEVMDWNDKSYYISTNVDFDTGRMPMAIWINKSDAVCSK